MTPEQYGVVQAAQVYDAQNRPATANWARVPDDQVLRLLTGARLYRQRGEGRPCTIADQIRWTFQWIKDNYGPKE